MGIRIRKMMGYGLTDVVKNDPRLNHSAPVFDYALSGRKALDAYIARSVTEGHADAARGLVKAQEEDLGRVSFNVQECVQWGTSDGGLKNVLCVRPLAWEDWYRFDDAIDWVEQSHSKKSQRDKVKVLPHGIYPHVGYMDARTGERVSNDVFAWIRLQSYLRDHPKKRRVVEKDPSALDDLAARAGFTDNAEAEAFCVPIVPDEVRWMLEFTEVFNSPDTWLQLRPMVYTWWA
jgi:hypothetical protein